MASLADLFVSYKSVTPKQSQKPEPREEVSFDTARARLQALASSTPSMDDVTLPEIEEAVEENPKESSTKGPALIKFWAPESNGTNPLTGTSGAYVPTGPTIKYNRGNLQKEIEDLFKKNNINIVATSGKRAAGAAGRAKSKSHHVPGNAVDIIPGEGETWQSIRKKMTENPEIVQFFHSNGLGVIDETDPSTMAKTGATGKHYHIGPDTLAVKTWDKWMGDVTVKPKTGNQKEWTKNIYNAFKKGLKKEYGGEYDDSTYDRIAAYMTYQAALESGYGEKANGYNYGGHKRNGKTINYKSMDEFVRAHLKTLKKWDFMSSQSLEDYVNSLYQGDYAYSTSDLPQGYFNKVRGTVDRVNGYLGLSAKFGGKFTNIRQLYEESFSKYRRQSI